MAIRTLTTQEKTDLENYAPFRNIVNSYAGVIATSFRLYNPDTSGVGVDGFLTLCKRKALAENIFFNGLQFVTLDKFVRVFIELYDGTVEVGDGQTSTIYAALGNSTGSPIGNQLNVFSDLAFKEIAKSVDIPFTR